MSFHRRQTWLWSLSCGVSISGRDPSATSSAMVPGALLRIDICFGPILKRGG